MGVQKDAGEILLFLYDKLIVKNKSQISSREIRDETGWEGSRINHAYYYLKDLGAVKDILTMGNDNGLLHFSIMRLYPEAINTVENQPEFKRNFGFEVNLGLLKFSWGASQ